MFKLNSSRIGRAIGDGAQVFGAILSAASAVRNHRRPENRDLEAIGINPDRFPDVR